MDLKEIRAVDETQLRKFGLLMAIPLAAISVYLFFKGRPAAPFVLALGVLFPVFGLIFARALKPVYIGWMTFSYYMSMVITYVVLTVFFFAILSPVGIIMRFFGKDLLSRRFPGNEPSYWVDAESYPDDIERYSKPY